MGTRNITTFITNTQRIDTYCQWDGYLEGVGFDLLNALQPLVVEDRLDELSNAIDTKIFDPTEEQRHSYLVECGQRPNNRSGMINLEVSQSLEEKYPLMHRNTNGADLITKVMEAEAPLPADLLDVGDGVKVGDYGTEYMYTVNIPGRTLSVVGYCIEAEVDLNRLKTESPESIVESLKALVVDD